MTIYHNPDSCNKCSGKNIVDVVDMADGHMSECKTKCTECGHIDYWAFGYFESGSEIESKCKTYEINHELKKL